MIIFVEINETINFDVFKASFFVFQPELASFLIVAQTDFVSVALVSHYVEVFSAVYLH